MLSCPELLSPAGSLEALKYAVMYGADAVYCALPRFGMRAAPVNLTIGELHDGCIFAHARGKKVYLTLNNLPTNDELSELPQYIKDAAEAGVDAFIIADLGVLSLAKQYAPDVDVHFSTQAGITNYAAATMAYNLGAKRVVLARELTLTDIAQIRDNTPPELELEALCARRHVHERFWSVPAFQLYDRAQRQPRRMCPALPLEILSCRRKPPRPVYAHWRK